MGETLSSADFRRELVKIMPGYSWVVRRPLKGTKTLRAIGTTSSGFNRTSTLMVEKIQIAGGTFAYEAKSSGYGTHAPWLGSNRDGTLARALRGLQDYYSRQANSFRAHAAALEGGRKDPA